MPNKAIKVYAGRLNRDELRFNENVYIPAIENLANRLFPNDIKEARKRISIRYIEGRRIHIYDPSPEYKRAIAKFTKKT